MIPFSIVQALTPCQWWKRQCDPIAARASSCRLGPDLRSEPSCGEDWCVNSCEPGPCSPDDGAAACVFGLANIRTFAFTSQRSIFLSVLILTGPLSILKMHDEVLTSPS